MNSVSSPSYHPLNQVSSHDSEQQDSLSLSHPQSTSESDPMGALHRFIRFGGWRRNLSLCIMTASLFFIFYSRDSPLGYLLPISSDDAHFTGQCRPPWGQPSQRYALMIDAGSTGSRIHVYRFSSCLSTSKASSSILPTLDHELFFKTQPGLSSYAGRPKEAAESLRPLLQAAPEGALFDERRCTPISVKATAGLRLLGEQESHDILAEVDTWLRREWPFKLPDQEAVTIMDGADEGVHAWVTINYLLKMIGPSSTKSKNVTAAVMDLGGASTQIVFEPQGVKLEPGGHVYQLAFGGRSHALYQHSHLGYGLMEARRAVHQLIGYGEMWRRKVSWSSLSVAGPIGNPCLLRDSGRKVTLVSDGTGGKSQTVEFIGNGGGFEACSRVVEIIMAKQTICKLQPCAFGGVYQPLLSESFPRGPIYALSYFYDRLYPLGFKSSFTLNELLKLVKLVCKGPGPNGWNPSDFSNSQEAIEELNGRPEACLDLTFIYNILSFGYELEGSREIIISKKINGVELGWALGATIDLLEKSKIQGCKSS